jgi:hypothetical protein
MDCSLSRTEAIELLARRRAALDAVIGEAEAGLAGAAERVPEIFLSEERYARHLRIAERDWSTSSPSGCARDSAPGRCRARSEGERREMGGAIHGASRPQ